MSGEPNDNTYITGLPPTADSEAVKRVFEQYGVTVVQSKVLPLNGNATHAVGLVRFSTLVEARQVVETMNGQELCGMEGYPLKIGYSYSQKQRETKGKGSFDQAAGGWGGKGGAVPYGGGGDSSSTSQSIYCAGLPSDVDDAMAKAFFEGFGEVNYVKLMPPNPHFPDGKRAAIVEFKEASSAKSMTQQPLLLEGETQALKVSLCEPQGGKGGADGGWGQDGGQQDVGYEKGGGWNGGGMGGGGMCGGMGGGKGWGKGPADVIVDGLEASGALPGAVAVTSDLYIANLPADTTDVGLYRMFSPFGPIKAVKTMNNPDGSCKGIAFVNFLMPESAANSINILNNCELPDGTPLIVRLKIQK